jgi:lysophospholipase L1-like esterase
MQLKLSKGSIIAIVVGVALCCIAIVSELLSSSPNGIGPYQVILLILGGLIIGLGLLPSDHILSKLTLLCLGCVVSLIILEGMLLLLSRANVSVTFPDTRELLNDDVLGKRTPPDSAGHDTRGWRNLSALEQADIVTIGDSQTWGVNATLAETYPSILSELTDRSVYSMAQGSYGAVQYRLLSERALELSPQLVVIGMYFGNDFADAYSIVYGDYAHQDLRDPLFDMSAMTQTIAERAQSLQPDGLVSQQAARINPANLTLWERTQSATYIGKFLTNVGVFKVLDTGEALRQIENNLQQVEKFPELLDRYDDGDVQTFFTPAYRQLVVDTELPAIQEGIRITKQEYASIKDFLIASDIEFLVVFIPTKETVYAPYLESLNDKYSELVEQEAEIHDEMIDFFDENSISYVDTLSELQQAVVDGIVIYPPTFDGHPTGHGYQVIAEVVADYINENDLMKQAPSF